MDGDSSGRDEMATPERMLVQVAVTGPRRKSITVLPIREAIQEADGRLYVRETRHHPDFPTTLHEYGYVFRGGRLVDIDTGRPFVHDDNPGDQDHNHQRY